MKFGKFLNRFYTIRLIKNYYVLVGFTFCFTISIIGITTEDIAHNISFRDALKEGHHYITPILLGFIGSFVGWIIQKNRNQRDRLVKELLENKNKFSLIVDNIPSLVSYLDKDLKYQYVNKTYTDWYKVSKESLYNKHIRSIIGENNFNNIALPNINKAFEGEKATFQITLKFPDSKEHHLLTSIVPDFDEHNNVIGIYSLVNDISDFKKNEELIKQHYEELVNSLNTKRKFFSIIAHDLKNPFNSIIGFSELVLQKIEEKKYDRAMYLASVLANNAKDTFNLLENLLRWANSNSLAISLQLEKVNLNEVIEEELKLLRANATLKGIEIDFISAENHSLTADTQMLKLIIRNLVSNAIKYTNSGGKVLVKVEPSQDHYCISIADNGIGMNEEVKEKIFILDTKKTRIGTAGEKGTGLGLILCKDFIEKHKGKIFIESQPGVGSKFSFTLPR